MAVGARYGRLESCKIASCKSAARNGLTKVCRRAGCQGSLQAELTCAQSSEVPSAACRSNRVIPVCIRVFVPLA